jgi:hypothetical protein
VLMGEVDPDKPEVVVIPGGLSAVQFVRCQLHHVIVFSLWAQRVPSLQYHGVWGERLIATSYSLSTLACSLTSIHGPAPDQMLDGCGKGVQE